MGFFFLIAVVFWLMIVGSVVNANGWCWCRNGYDCYFCVYFQFLWNTISNLTFALDGINFWVHVIWHEHIQSFRDCSAGYNTPVSRSDLVFEQQIFGCDRNGKKMKGACKLKRQSMKCFHFLGCLSCGFPFPGVYSLLLLWGSCFFLGLHNWPWFLMIVSFWWEWLPFYEQETIHY